MATLYEILDSAHDGEAIAQIGRNLNLSPDETRAAVSALLPALSEGLKRSTASFDGLGNVFALMGQDNRLGALYDNVDNAFSAEGLEAGENAATLIFGSPQVKDAVVGEAQKFSGISGSVLNKLLPVLAGMVLSGMMRGGSSKAAPTSQADASGGLGDILGQIFGRGVPSSSGAPAPSQFPLPGGTGGGLGDILGQIFGRGASSGPAPVPQQMPGAPSPSGQGVPIPGGGGDILGSIFGEVLKGIQNGTIKPVIVGGGGPIQIPTGPDGTPQIPGGDIFGKILKDVLGGALGGGAGGAGGGGSVQLPQGGGVEGPQAPQAGPVGQAPNPPMKDLSDLTKQLGVIGGAGAALLGDRLEPGQDIDQDHRENIQNVFNRFYGEK